MKLAELQIGRNVQALRPDPVHGPGQTKSGKQPEGTQEVRQNFNEILSRKISEQSHVKFSAHAMKRMSERSIHPSQLELDRLNEGVEKAREKGANSSLILVDEMAYVVSVKNQTVITALDKNAAQGNVFSNIDSVAIV